MRTAEEILVILNDIIAEGDKPEGTVGDRVLTAIRARDIEVMEEAAMMICVGCPDIGIVKETYGWVHPAAEEYEGGTVRMGCHASSIHDRIAELKAEQEKSR